MKIALVIALVAFVITAALVPMLMLILSVGLGILHAIGLPINVTVNGVRVGRIIRFKYIEEKQ